MQTYRTITLESVREAERHIRPFVRRTPMVELLPGTGIHLKLENVHPEVNAFKIRGAAYRVATEHAWEVVTAAIGSHGFAVGRVCQRTKQTATCFMPENAPEEKKEKMQLMVARVIIEGGDFSETEKAAQEYAARKNLPFIHPYNDPEIIAGQGTIALEIADIPALRRVYVPVGGGGLIAGIAIALKELRPEVKIIGVQPAAMHAMSASVQAGAIVRVEPATSLAGPLCVNPAPGSIPFEYIQRYVNKFILPTEKQIRAAMLGIYERTGHMVEGAGAIAVAAALADPGRLDLTESGIGTSVCIVTGGNISEARFEKEAFREEKVHG